MTNDTILHTVCPPRIQEDNVISGYHVGSKLMIYGHNYYTMDSVGASKEYAD